MTFEDQGVEVGDTDRAWLRAGGQDWPRCGEEYNEWECTLPVGHEGPHVAHMYDGQVCDRWPTKRLPVEYRVVEGL